ncbi:MarR family winged helix-turn-helix transcriptional regulator [Yimella sp. cx-51]|uniref:MarR family winged helix-turn-helix transcriptional regulator n=1 Tax=Yimella sp. cx-51 TaxID=2770551 RepID=UPI00165E88C4|nr:MarR family transcriptional regulator [Yimella sp. cx-51]MBC9957850.1 MarR family transcriptional regulator [Yimella sp. cx-51]QTH37987.1 MarR family transcriptional regulator [Yimella sp. cx-51]
MNSSDQPRWLDDEQQRVWRQWLRSHRELNAAIARQLQDDGGLSDADFAVLVSVSEAPDQRIRATALADSMLWERSRLSHQVRRMETRGLVQRVECEQDRRGAWVEITAAGTKALQDVAPGHVETVRRYLFDALDADSLAALDRITQTITETIDCPAHAISPA